MSVYRILTVLFLALPLLLGCDTGTTSTGSPEPPPATYKGSGPIKVTCTTGMVADLVKNIGGERVEVTQLMGAGVDPHLYKTSPGDVAALDGADVIFFSGLHLEGKMIDDFQELGKTKPVIAVSGSLQHSRLLTDGETHDPHIWFDVALWSEAGQVVQSALSTFDPAHSKEYQERGDALQKKMTELDQFCRDELKKIPEPQRVMITAHDAFRYFGKAYGIEVRGIQGVSTDSEAGVKQINELVDFLVQRKIKAIFVETSVSEANVKSLIEGCKAQKHTVVIGGELFSDAMGEPGTPEGTYEGMIRHNVTTIVKALQ